jgi:hypothetical protein
MNGPIPTIVTEGIQENDSKKLQQIIASYSQETLKSTERMLEYCGLSENAGVKTLMLLDEQGEKLNRANEGLNVVENDLESVENNLNRLEFDCCCCCYSRRAKNRGGLFSCCVGFVRKKCGYCKKTNSCSNLSRQSSQEVTSLRSKNESASIMKSNSNINSNTEVNITPISTNINTATENQIAQNLEQLMYSLGTLNSLAQNVGTELGGQIKQIKVIAQHANLAVNQVHDADIVGKRIINK